MSLWTARLAYSIAFYVLVAVLVIVMKPSMIFERNGNPRTFGIGRNKTTFAFGTLCVVLAILCFYMFAWIDLVFGVNSAHF